MKCALSDMLWAHTNHKPSKYFLANQTGTKTINVIAFINMSPQVDSCETGGDGENDFKAKDTVKPELIHVYILENRFSLGQHSQNKFQSDWLIYAISGNPGACFISPLRNKIMFTMFRVATTSTLNSRTNCWY